MLLSDPEADRVELVRNALQELLSRHALHEDKVILSVPGQSGLTKYSKLPPIEAKKIPDIVQYEARQQIPFPLDQVVWDWQRLPGGHGGSRLRDRCRSGDLRDEAGAGV